MTPKAYETLTSLHQMLEEMVHVRAQLRAYEQAVSGLPDSAMTTEAMDVRSGMMNVLREKGWIGPTQAFILRRELDEAKRLLRAVVLDEPLAKAEADRFLSGAGT